MLDNLDVVVCMTDGLDRDETLIEFVSRFPKTLHGAATSR